MLQSLVHIASGSGLAINLRFVAFGVQLVCLTWMGVLVWRTLAASSLV